MSLVDEDDRLRRLEYAIFGLTGNNGLVSEVRSLRRELREWRAAEERKAEEQAKERKMDMRWRIGTALTIVAAIIAAAGIVASAL